MGFTFAIYLRNFTQLYLITNHYYWHFYAKTRISWIIFLKTTFYMVSFLTFALFNFIAGLVGHVDLFGFVFLLCWPGQLNPAKCSFCGHSETGLGAFCFSHTSTVWPRSLHNGHNVKAAKMWKGLLWCRQASRRSVVVWTLFKGLGLKRCYVRMMASYEYGLHVDGTRERKH